MSRHKKIALSIFAGVVLLSMLRGYIIARKEGKNLDGVTVAWNSFAKGVNSLFSPVGIVIIVGLGSWFFADPKKSN